MKKLFYVSLLLSAVISLWSCKDSKESEKKVDEFYGFIIEKDFKSTIGLTSDILWENHEKDAWVYLLQARHDNWGLPKSWELTYTGFKTSKIGKITELRFEVTNEGGTTYEIFELIEEDGKMKIVKYSFTGNSDYVTIEDEAEVAELPEFKTEEKTVDSFYKMYNSGNFEALSEFVTSKNASKQDLENLAVQLKEKFDIYGKITDVEKTDAAEFGEDENKGYAVLYKITYKSGDISFEKFEFSAVDEIGLIQFYNWAEDPEKL